MPHYVEHDENGRVIAFYGDNAPAGCTVLHPDDLHVLGCNRFDEWVVVDGRVTRNPNFDAILAEESRIAALRASDQGMARVLEDLIAALEAKGVLSVSDLPQVAQDKINARVSLRGN